MGSLDPSGYSAKKNGKTLAHSTQAREEEKPLKEVVASARKHKPDDLSKSMEFANAEIEDVTKNDKENVVKTKELEDKILY